MDARFRLIDAVANLVRVARSWGQRARTDPGPPNASMESGCTYCSSKPVELRGELIFGHQHFDERIQGHARRRIVEVTGEQVGVHVRNTVVKDREVDLGRLEDLMERPRRGEDLAPLGGRLLGGEPCWIGHVSPAPDRRRVAGQRSSGAKVCVGAASLQKATAPFGLLRASLSADIAFDSGPPPVPVLGPSSRRDVALVPLPSHAGKGWRASGPRRWCEAGVVVRVRRYREDMEDAPRCRNCMGAARSRG